MSEDLQNYGISDESKWLPVLRKKLRKMGIHARPTRLLVGPTECYLLLANQSELFEDVRITRRPMIVVHDDPLVRYAERMGGEIVNIIRRDDD